MANYIMNHTGTELDTTINKVLNLEQTQGEATDKIMSQNAVTTELELKVDKVTGKDLSTNDYTTDEKTKLAGIEAEATKTVIVQATGTSEASVMSQKAVTDAISGGSGVTVVQTTGTSTTDVMSQKATTDSIINQNGTGDNKVKINSASPTSTTYNTTLIDSNGTNSVGSSSVIIGGKVTSDGTDTTVAVGAGCTSARYGVSIGASALCTAQNSTAVGANATIASDYSTAIGRSANISSSSYANSVAIGASSLVAASNATCIGKSSQVAGAYSVALGANSTTTEASTVSVGDGSTSTDYGTRRIVNVKDPVNAQDVTTKNYVDGKVGTLTTNNSTAQTVPTTAESFSSAINLHKVSKTGTFEDITNNAGWNFLNRLKTFKLPDSTSMPTSLISVNNNYYIDQSSTIISRSSDGRVWSYISVDDTNTIPAPGQNKRNCKFLQGASNRIIYIFTYSDGTNSITNIYYSDNGTTWSKSATSFTITGTTYYLQNAVINSATGIGYIIVSPTSTSDPHMYITTDNGANWATTTAITGMTTYSRNAYDLGAVYLEPFYFVPDIYNSPKVFFLDTRDGTAITNNTWQTLTNVGTGTILNIASDGTDFIFTNSDNKIYKAPLANIVAGDLVTTNVTSLGPVYDLKWKTNKYIGVRDTESVNYYLESTDGVTFTSTLLQAPYHYAMRLVDSTSTSTIVVPNNQIAYHLKDSYSNKTLSVLQGGLESKDTSEMSRFLNVPYSTTLFTNTSGVYTTTITLNDHYLLYNKILIFCGPASVNTVTGMTCTIFYPQLQQTQTNKVQCMCDVGSGTTAYSHRQITLSFNNKTVTLSNALNTLIAASPVAVTITDATNTSDSLHVYHIIGER